MANLKPFRPAGDHHRSCTGSCAQMPLVEMQDVFRINAGMVSVMNAGATP